MPEYEHPPIREALIDIRVDGVVDQSIDAFRMVRDQLRSSYPKAEEVQQWSAALELGPEQREVKAMPQLGKLVGLFFRTADEKQMAQFRVDGFTLNRFRPYRGWDDLLAEAMRLWTFYRESARPTAVTRLAVRTTNLIEIPTSRFKTEEWFGIEVPDFLGRQDATIDGFAMRSLVALSESENRCIINFASQKPVGPGSAFLLDTDVFRAVQLSPDDSGMWDTLREFRTIKNGIFERVLTSRTKELFNP